MLQMCKSEPTETQHVRLLRSQLKMMELEYCSIMGIPNFNSDFVNQVVNYDSITRLHPVRKYLLEISIEVERIASLCNINDLEAITDLRKLMEKINTLMLEAYKTHYDKY